MTKTVLLFVFFLMVQVAFGCADSELFDFGGYSVSDSGEYSFGNSARQDGNLVIIDTSFINLVLQNPTGQELQKNREELFYLISRGSKQALLAGIKVFLHILEHPILSRG